MPSLSFPCDAEQLLPHKGRMCCIDKLVTLDEQEATAEVVLEANHILLNSKGQFERCGFIELAAQTAGAMQGAQMLIQQTIPSLAMLAGIQHFTVHADAKLGDTLIIEINILGELDGMSSLSFNIKRENQLLAEGRLKVFIPPQENLPSH